MNNGGRPLNLLGDKHGVALVSSCKCYLKYKETPSGVLCGRLWKGSKRKVLS